MGERTRGRILLVTCQSHAFLSLQLYSGHGIKVKIIMTKYFPLGCKGPTDCDPESTGGSRFGFLGSIIN